MVDPDDSEIEENSLTPPDECFIQVVHHVGPMWSIDGHPLTVPPGVDVPAFILSRVQAPSSECEGTLIRVSDQGSVFELTFNHDGSVALAESLDGQHLKMLEDAQAAWIRPAGIISGPSNDPRRFIGVHPGAGTSTWANLLEGRDLGLSMPADGLVTAVVRATPAGMHKAKLMVGEYGVSRFQAFLVVADAPGRTLPAAKREVKVLSSAAPVVEISWIPKLRGLEDPSTVATSISKIVSKINNRLESAQVRIPRGFADPVKGKRK